MFRRKYWIPAFLAIPTILYIVLAPACMTFRSTDSEMIEQFRAKGIELQTGYRTISGRKLHFARTGSDELPTLLFVHGTPGSWNAFAGYLRDSVLLRRYRMIAVDRPGFGFSDFGEALPLKEQSKLIGGLIGEWKNGQPFFLVGHSMGGPVILQLAIDFPSSIDGLIVLAGSIDPSLEKPEKWRPLIINTPLRLLVPGALRPSNEELWYLKKDLVDLKGVLDKVLCPVYFIHGEKDSWVPPGNVAYGQSMLVNAAAVGVQYLPGANHFIPWNKYNEIRDFLIAFRQSNAIERTKTSE